ncbi:MAG: hypothetical protein ACERIH_05440 [Labilibaculum antarcticum]
MNILNESLTIYQIFKDIIIPSLGVLSTLTIGIFIALILKRRDEKAKIKSLLIDNYMEYLNKRTCFVEYESLYYSYEILKDIYINYKDYFEDHANRHHPLGLIKETRDTYEIKLESINQVDSAWTPYTYKFCFLLGVKTYNKKAEELENRIVKEIIDDNSRSIFVSDLKQIIRKDDVIVKNMNASNLHMIKHGIDLINEKIAKRYSEYQLKIFKPYDNLIANLIDKK